MIQIRSDSSILAGSVVVVLLLAELHDKRFLQQAYANGKWTWRKAAQQFVVLCCCKMVL